MYLWSARLEIMYDYYIGMLSHIEPLLLIRRKFDVLGVNIPPVFINLN